MRKTANTLTIRKNPDNPMISGVVIDGHKIEGVYAYTLKENAEPINGITRWPSITLSVEITGEIKVDLESRP